uniref:Chemokine interleukin-8-like domain-containing protein n=1 Tax=Maylandia zebra TaxID=106582 RepID=A0A3P9CDJ4_9CICH
MSVCSVTLILGLLIIFFELRNLRTSVHELVYCKNMHGLLEMSPGQCCFKFFTGRIPPKKIVSVIKTHSACLEKAFVIGTAAGRRICVSQSVTWAQEAFKQKQIGDE